MSRKYFKEQVSGMDYRKFKIYDSGISFNLVGMDRKNHEFWNVGVGSGAEMTELIMIQLCNLYDNAAKNNTTIEKFADSVARSLKEYYKARKEGADVMGISTDGKEN